MIENPKEIECTMKITMKVGDWEILRDQLESKWPSSDLYMQITSILVDARKIFYPESLDD